MKSINQIIPLASFRIINENYISFNTRRNRKINLTEYYDLVYEYKNDCLKASVEYKKTFYDDVDLDPDENIFFSITIIPFGSLNTPNLR